MAEENPEMWRSSKAPLKKRRAEDQDSGSSGRSDCRYEGCRRPTMEKGRGIRHQFCGLTHQEFFMADLADKYDRGERDEIPEASEAGSLAEQQNKKCKLPGCNESVSVDSTTGDEFDFCRKGHALQYIENCTRQWTAKGRLCKFQPCTRHVWVDENSKRCYDFCGFGHAKLAAAAKGLSAPPQTPRSDPVKPVGNEGKASSSEKTPQRSISQEASVNLQVKIDKERGYHAKILESDLENCLRQSLDNDKLGSANADPTEKFSTGINIIEFHPWELVSEFQGLKPRYFLHYIDSNQTTQRTTKDGFRWKQTSAAHRQKCRNNRLQTTYFFYELKDTDPKNDHLGDHVRSYRQCTKKGKPSRWKMHEIALPGMTKGLPSLTPVIWKIFQNSNGEPVWPPLPDQEEIRPVDCARTETTSISSRDTAHNGEQMETSKMSFSLLAEDSPRSQEMREPIPYEDGNTPLTSFSNSPTIELEKSMFASSLTDGLENFNQYIDAANESLLMCSTGDSNFDYPTIDADDSMLWSPYM